MEKEQQKIFDILSIKLEKSVLKYSDFEREFILITDILEKKLKVLAQMNKNNKEVAIAYKIKVQ